MNCRLDEIKKVSDRFHWLSSPEVVAACEAAEEVAHELGGEARFNGGFIAVFATATDDKTGQRALAMLAKSGWHRQGTGYEVNNKWCLETYPHPSEALPDKRGVGINVYLALAGTRCRLVQIGEKKEPIYDLKCDEA